MNPTLRLRELVRELPQAAVEGPLDREITGLAYDSRRLTPGMAFFALPGLNEDGHDYIPLAIARGAVAVFCERNGFVPHRATKIKVPDVRVAMARAAAAFHGHPSRRLKVVAVTGTAAKTSVSFMLKAMLDAAGFRTGLISTIHHKVGDRVIPAQRTTPEAVEVQQMLAAMVRAGCQTCVMEVSSHALQQHRVLGVEFDLAVFTNLGLDHLDYHGSIEEYYQAKKRLFALVQAGHKRGGSVINIDDPYGRRLVRETSAEVRLTYGLGDAASLRAKEIELRKDGVRMVIQGPGVEFDCRLPLLGRYSIYNALAAIGAASLLQLPVPVIRRALAHLAPIPGRLEPVNLGQPFRVLVDYAHTEESLRQTLCTLREITPGRLLLTFGCGGTRDTSKRAGMGRAAAELADVTILTTDNARREAPADIAAEIAAGYRDVRPDGYRMELDRARAIDDLIREAGAGDTVLIAGKGHETYQEFESTVVPFDDREQARASLEALGHPRRRPAVRRPPALVL